MYIFANLKMVLLIAVQWRVPCGKAVVALHTFLCHRGKYQDAPTPLKDEHWRVWMTFSKPFSFPLSLIFRLAAKLWLSFSSIALWQASSGSLWKVCIFMLCWPSLSSQRGSTSGGIFWSVGVGVIIFMCILLTLLLTFDILIMSVKRLTQIRCHFTSLQEAQWFSSWLGALPRLTSMMWGKVTDSVKGLNDFM